MSPAAREGPIPDAFDRLSVLHPLRPIKDDASRDAAIRFIEQLALLRNPTVDQADYLGTLTQLVGAYHATMRDSAVRYGSKTTWLRKLVGYATRPSRSRAEPDDRTEPAEPQASSIDVGVRILQPESNYHLFAESGSSRTRSIRTRSSVV